MARASPGARMPVSSVAMTRLLNATLVALTSRRHWSGSGVPADDRFQVITEHAKTLLVADPHYLGINCSDGAILVRITLRKGSSDDKKRALYRTIVENLEARPDVRKEDVVVTLIENEAIDWS